MTDQALTMDDVFCLLGHAEYLRGEGQTDMPAYFYGLAERIALVIDDAGLARRVREMATGAVNGH